MPDLNYLKSILDYNPDTGEFVWKVKSNSVVFAGSNAGSKRKDGYVTIKINNKIYKAHRLAYYFVTGIDPITKEIDHINGDTSNNKFINLRIANHSQNGKNLCKSKRNTSNFKGVSFLKNRNKWQVNITLNYKNIYLGSYKSKFYAALVYARAAKKYFGKWRRVI